MRVSRVPKQKTSTLAAALPPEQPGGLAVRPQGGADGPADVGCAAAAPGYGAAGAPPRRGQPDPRHDPAQRGQFLRGAGGERFVPEGLRVGGHQAEHGLLLPPVLRRVGGRDLQHRLGLDASVGSERQQLPRRAGGVQEESAEHLVVGADLVVPGDEGGAARPVQVQQIGRVQ
jgi:hypothetical protein